MNGETGGFVTDNWIRRALALIIIMMSGLMSVALSKESGLCLAQASNETDPVVASFELRPGVIVDPPKGAAYLMNPHRGIDAVDLSSGNLLWSTSNATKPLAAFDDRLAAQTDPQPPNFHALPLVMLAANDGSVVSRISIPMPSDVAPSVSSGLGTSFNTTTRVDRDRLTLWWSYSARTISGVNRLGAEPPGRHENGAVSINLKTEQIETLTPQQASVAMRDKHKAPQVTASDALLTPPQLAGKFFFATKLQPEHAILKRWDADSGAPLPDIELDSRFAIALASADGADLVTAKAVGANSVGIEVYLWSIYSLATGERIAQIRIAQSPTSCFVWHSLLVYEGLPVTQRINGVLQSEPLELRAVDIHTAIVAWKRAIRDTAYRGSYPPVP